MTLGFLLFISDLSHHRTYRSVYGGSKLNNYVLTGNGLLVKAGPFFSER